MTSPNRFQVAPRLLAAALFVVGCDDESIHAPGDLDELTRTAEYAGEDDQELETTHELFLTCDETISFTVVDPSIAQAYLPPEHTLYTEDGLAQVLVVVQECSEAVYDGIDFAPLELNHFWIRRTGPFEVAPIPGAVQTVPTFYWYQHHMLTTNWVFFFKAWQAGFRIGLARDIDIGPLGGATRTVDVVEHRFGPHEIGYDWIHEVNPFPPVPLGINHRVEGMQRWRWWMGEADVGGRRLDMHARGLIFQSASDNPVEITAHPWSILGKFGTSLFGLGKDFEMDFQATINTTLEAD